MSFTPRLRLDSCMIRLMKNVTYFAGKKPVTILVKIPLDTCMPLSASQPRVAQYAKVPTVHGIIWRRLWPYPGRARPPQTT